MHLALPADPLPGPGSPPPHCIAHSFLGPSSRRALASSRNASQTQNPNPIHSQQALNILAEQDSSDKVTELPPPVAQDMLADQVGHAPRLPAPPPTACPQSCP